MNPVVALNITYHVLMNETEFEPSELTPWAILVADFQAKSGDPNFKFYVSTMLEIDRALDRLVVRERLLKELLSSKKSIDGSDWEDLRKEAAVPDFIDELLYNRASLGGGYGEGYEVPVTFADKLGFTSEHYHSIDTILWFVHWLLMKKGLTKPAAWLFPGQNNFGTEVIMPVDNFSAWEPLFRVHKIRAEFFSENFWRVSKGEDEPKNCLIVIKHGKDEDTKTVPSVDDWYYCGKDLSMFKQGQTLAQRILTFKNWGYDRDSAWGFFNPETGFFSKVYLPSECADVKTELHFENDEALEGENQIFLESYVSAVFDSVYGRQETKVDKSKTQKKTVKKRKK